MPTHVILGDGVAGMSAAEAIRVHRPKDEIVVVSDDPQPFYYRASLTNYLMGELSDEELFALPPDGFDRLAIRRVAARATGLDVAGRRVLLSEGSPLAYDRLLIATGARARRLATKAADPERGVVGADLPGVTVMRTLYDAKRMLEARQKAKRAVVLGGGILGLELAQGLRAGNVAVTLLHRGEWLLDRVVDRRAGELIAKRMERDGIDVRVASGIAEIRGGAKGVKEVLLDGGSVVRADLVAVAIGNAPNTEWLAGSGFELHHGLLPVDRRMQVRGAGLFAAGDVVHFEDEALLAQNPGGLWQVAKKQGFVAGLNMALDDAAAPAEYRPGVLYNATRAWDLDLGTLGAHVASPAPDDRVVEFEGRKDGKPVYKRALLRGDRVLGALLLGDRREGHALRRLMNLRGAAGDVSAIAAHLFDPEFDLFAWVAAQERQPGVVRANQTLFLPRLPRPPSVLAREKPIAKRDLLGKPEAATDLLQKPVARTLTLLSGGTERAFAATPVRIGRTPDCDVVVGDAGVGPEVLTLAPEGAAWMASSSGGRRTAAARNGIALRTAAALDDLDAISLGDWKAVVRIRSLDAVPFDGAQGRRPAARTSPQASDAWLIGTARHRLPAGVSSRGAGADNPLHVMGGGVSPAHAQIQAVGEPRAWFVTDVGSVAGTFVSGDRVFVPRRLAPGDTLRLGSVSLRFEIGGAAPAEDPAKPSAPLGRERAYLVGVEGPNARRALEIRGGSTLGRGLDVDVRIDDPLLSRIHARFDAEGGGFSVTDLGSTNGISIDAEKADAGRGVSLPEGARLRLGSTVYRFQTALPSERVASGDDEDVGGSGLTRTIPYRKSGPRLEIDQDGPPAVVLLAGERIAVGRSARNGVVLPLLDVSKAHAELTVSGDTYDVTDLESRQGTRVNGVRLTPNFRRALADKDVIEFATVRAVFRLGTGVLDAGEAPPPARAALRLTEPPPHLTSDPILLTGDGPFVIGRKAGAAMIVIPIETISKVHARIVRKDGVYQIVDAGSSYGTVVRGKRLTLGESETLADGEVFLLQDIPIRFEIEAAPARASGPLARGMAGATPESRGFSIGGGEAGNPLEENLEKTVGEELDACIGCHDCMRACPLPAAAVVTIGALNGYAEGIGSPSEIVRGFVSDCTQCHACVPVCPADIHRSRIVLWNKLKDVPSPSRRVSVQVGTQQVESDWTLADLSKRLEPHPLFVTLSGSERLELLGRSRVRRLVPGEALLVEGAYSDAVWLVVEGRLEVGLGVGTEVFHRTTLLGAGGTVGEDSCLSDQPSEVAVRALDVSTAVGLPKYALELHAKRNPEFKRVLERLHVGRAVEVHLRRLNALSKFSDDALVDLRDRFEGERYRPGEAILVAEEAADVFLLVRRGFVREVRRHDGREITANYLKAGDAFGGSDSQRKGAPLRFEAASSVEVLAVGLGALLEVDRRHPGLAAALLPLANVGVAPAAGSTALFQEAHDAGVVHGRDLLVIDTRICVDCDNCVSACERRHGASRLDRVGTAKQVGPYQIPASCYHCDDPKCLFCDVDGIVRSPSGEIRITDTCIGCGQCAERCPYDNIRMAAREPEPLPLLHRLLPDPILSLFGMVHESSADEFERIAIKCDLCEGYKNGPACVRACPVGAAARVDPLQFFAEAGRTAP